MKITDTPNIVERADKTGHTRNILRRTRPFLAWDGEGWTSAAGEHHYALFGNSEGDTVTARSLTWRQCFPLLFKAPANAHHVIYAGTYDIVKMIDHETTDVHLALMQGRTVYLDQYRVQFLRGKMLRITDRELRETRTLYDVFTFFGGSFVKACREYLDMDTPINSFAPETVGDVLDTVERMKAQRNTFTYSDMSDTVASYMGDELRLLVMLMSTFRNRLALVGIHPHQWHGPGAVASAMFKTHGIKHHKGSYTEDFRRIAESAYYGGRFEQFQRGTHVGTVYQYDIRSAYPAAMQHLPSLTGVTWQHGNDMLPPTMFGGNIGGVSCAAFHPFGLYYVNGETDNPIGCLPWRNARGSIYYPTTFANGWYWGIELPSHMLRHVTEWYHPIGITEERPFAFMAEMYRQRAILKKANQPHQLALKLALNSGYGKLAQSKGAKQNAQGEWLYPTFHEIVWAGWITAYTRRKISDAMHSVDPSQIIATETDSVFSLCPLPSLTVGDGLGEWECDVLDGIKYIKSGVSLVLKDGTWRFKTRGFTVKRKDNEVDIWSDFLAQRSTELVVKQTRFGTDPRQRERFGRWYEMVHRLKLDGTDIEKRIHSWCPACDRKVSYGDGLHSLITPPIPSSPSTPYRFTWTDAPEWVKALATDDYDEPILKLEYL